MNDIQRVPRRWFQIHLSTAVVLMFIAALFVWANAIGHRQEAFSTITFGFPLPFFSDNSGPAIGNDSGGYTMIFRHTTYIQIGPIRFSYDDNGWSWSVLFVNITVAAVVLTGAGAVIEYVVRRHRR